MRDPGDASSIVRLIDEGLISPHEIVAVFGKTEGNGCVNDFTRGYATVAVSVALARYLGISADEVRSRVAMVMSGGTEGGMTNGAPLVVRVAMKPISTLMSPLQSVDLRSKQAADASVERSDVCAAPAAAVVGESVVAFELANAFLEKFGGDSLREIQHNYERYLEQIKSY